ncbi:MAG: hypothetical protein ACI4EE_14105 [Lachnospiraceae bacterium]
MFEKFGEFDSVEELNKKAAELKEADNEKDLVALAEENGIDKQDAEDYMDDCTDDLATDFTAAVGKLRLESKDLKLSGVLMDWVNELIDLCVHDASFRAAVRRKGKDLAGYIALTAETGYQNRCVVDKRITQRAEQIKKIVGSHEFSIGIPDKKTRKELALKYYM